MSIAEMKNYTIPKTSLDPSGQKEKALLTKKFASQSSSSGRISQTVKTGCKAFRLGKTWRPSRGG
jgi:hypothetical protein